MIRAELERWLDAYERAWRSAGTVALAELFAPDATYSADPYEEPYRGLPAIADFWAGAREGPDEEFSMAARILAVEGDTGVARVDVDYGGARPQEYRDLWVIILGPDGRCTAFEEWPFWPGHGRVPASGAAG